VRRKNHPLRKVHERASGDIAGELPESTDAEMGKGFPTEGQDARNQKKNCRIRSLFVTTGVGKSVFHEKGFKVI